MGFRTVNPELKTKYDSHSKSAITPKNKPYKPAKAPNLETRVDKTTVEMGKKIRPNGKNQRRDPLAYPGEMTRYSHFNDGKNVHRISYRKRGDLESAVVKNKDRTSVRDLTAGKQPYFMYGSVRNSFDASQTIKKPFASVKGWANNYEARWNLKSKNKVGGMAVLGKSPGASTEGSVMYLTKAQGNALGSREKHYRTKTIDVKLETGKTVKAKTFVGSTDAWKPGGDYVGVREIPTRNRNYKPMSYKQVLKKTIKDYKLDRKFGIRSPRELLSVNNTKLQNPVRDYITHSRGATPTYF